MFKKPQPPVRNLIFYELFLNKQQYWTLAILQKKKKKKG